ncbi:hypothetical protein RB620_19295 [Paenibacillus sp. LHD-117]|uniref:hypothetical protein n=1 Tax=Paenibacillus sp. LHD-117 TaxID=3071412 RepID=UPI0027DEBAA2|nr:hypothetical protein [Paenibacillus sp. LHD-117]MDQ6421576.1 hypothetical protein [Paenibacillus sp. LHD-117]
MKRISAAALAITFVGLLLAKPAMLRADTASGRDGGVLLVYDSLALGTTMEGNVEALLRLLAAMGVPATLRQMERYDEDGDDLGAYKGIIAVRNDPELQSGYTRFAADLSRFPGMYLHVGPDMPAFFADQLRLETAISGPESARLSVGPLRLANFAAGAERMTYIAKASGKAYGELLWPGSERKAPFGIREGGIGFVPAFRSGSASELAMAYVLKDWLGLSGEGKVYLLYKDIYPFSDLALLAKTADTLYSAGIPFIYAVQPVYMNLGFPAMQRYMAVLEYAQAHNGTLFAGAPVLSPVAGIQRDTLKEKTALFLNVLAENGLVPLGVGADAGLYWSNGASFAETGMEPFNAMVLYPSGNPALLMHVGEPACRTFADSLLSVRWDELGPYWDARKPVSLPVDLAMTFGFPAVEAEMEGAVRELRDSWLPFADYKAGRHETRTAEHAMASSDGILTVDGRQISLRGNVSVDVDLEYQYRDLGQRSFERLFTVQNYFYMTMIVASLVLFGVLMAVGYRLYKSKFLK